MALRTRTRPQSPINGYWVQVGGIPCKNTQFPVPFFDRAERCIDDVAPGDNHDFQVDVSTMSGDLGNVMGSCCGGVPCARSVDWCPQGFTNAVNTYSGKWDHLTMLSRPSNGELAATLLARTNPSRPVVDLPVFIGELRELPDLFKRFGDSLPKKIADANLRYQFGIRPLARDLGNLLNFSDEFEKRAREIEALAEGGLRRKLALWNGTNTESVSSFQSSSSGPGSTFHSYQKFTSEEVSGFCRWIPTKKMPTTSAERRALARKAVLGLTVDFSTGWQLMPWSWLFDWCGSMGDFLMAERNIVPAVPQDVCILTGKTTTLSLDRVGGTYPAGQCQHFDFKRVSKFRSPASPTISAHLPGLSPRQLSILGSIAIQRYR